MFKPLFSCILYSISVVICVVFTSHHALGSTDKPLVELKESETEGNFLLEWDSDSQFQYIPAMRVGLNPDSTFVNLLEPNALSVLGTDSIFQLEVTPPTEKNVFYQVLLKDSTQNIWGDTEALVNLSGKSFQNIDLSPDFTFQTPFWSGNWDITRDEPNQTITLTLTYDNDKFLNDGNVYREEIEMAFDQGSGQVITPTKRVYINGLLAFEEIQSPFDMLTGLNYSNPFPVDTEARDVFSFAGRDMETYFNGIEIVNISGNAPAAPTESLLIDSTALDGQSLRNYIDTSTVPETFLEWSMFKSDTRTRGLWEYITIVNDNGDIPFIESAQLSFIYSLFDYSTD